MIEKIESPIVDFTLMKKNNRMPGLSGFIRAKNESEYIYAVIESWLTIVDELIIVFNDCTDNTEQEISRAIINFGNKVKAYHYVPKVYPQGSKEHIALAPDNIHSLVNYYNYALSMTTRKFSVKIDGDIIYDASVSYEIARFLLLPDTDMYFSLAGVNLIDNHGILFCPSNSPFCGMNDDLCIFPVSEKNIYKHRPEFEYLDLTGLRKYGHCFAYYHMKFVKNDMGFGNYLLYDNPNSHYVKITKEFIIGLRFLDLVTVLKNNNIPLRMPCELNIKASKNRNYKFIYKEKLRDAGIAITIGNILACYFSRIKANPIKFIKSLVNRLDQ